MRMNQARKQVSCLVRHHDMGDGRLHPDTARSIRKSIYRTVAGVVRDAESISRRLPAAGKALASEIRRDAAWAYRATRDMAAVLDAPECSTLPSINLLPDTSFETVVVDGGDICVLLDNAPPDTGPLTKRLKQMSTYMYLYGVAVDRGDTIIAQDLRAAVHDSLEEIKRRVAARVKSLHGFGLHDDADAIEQDWAWVPKVLVPIAKSLLYDGMREKSMDELIAEEILPTIKDISTIEKHSPTGLWSKKISRHLLDKKGAQKKGDTKRAWERFRNGFRPGRKEVVLRKETELQPSGGGGGLGLFEFNEVGQIENIRTKLKPMVYINHRRCTECAALAGGKMDECPDCGSRLDDATPKSHVPMTSIPEIAEAEGVLCQAGEILLAGAILEIWESGSKCCAMVHMSKSASKHLRSQGGAREGGALVQWRDSGKTSWVKQSGLRLFARQVFVYGPAIMETTIGQARFCFGAWVDFDDIDVQDIPPKFNLGDGVDVTCAKLMHYETAVIGGKAGTAMQISGTCTGVVVRVPKRATDQAEPMYDIRIGDTVIMHQAESTLRPRRGKSCKSNPDIRRMAHESYNAFDAEGYRRYRSHC